MQRREKGHETNLHFNKFPKVNVFWRGKTQSAVEMRWNFQISRKEQDDENCNNDDSNNTLNSKEEEECAENMLHLWQ